MRKEEAAARNMIIVIEGISAAGKTTWCNANAGRALIAETFPADRHLQPPSGLNTAQYWTKWNAKRWKDALDMEASKGLAVCDTDPLKLHYVWSLYTIGVADASQWELQLDATRQALLAKTIGFADAYFVKVIDPAVARRQRDRDRSRERTRFDLHVRLQQPLVEWYRRLDAVMGGIVSWELPVDGLSNTQPKHNKRRYDIDAFDAFVLSLSTAEIDTAADLR